MVASHKIDCKDSHADGLDRPANGEQTCKYEAADDLVSCSSDMEEWGMLNELGTRDRSQSVHIAPSCLPRAYDGHVYWLPFRLI